MLAFIIRDYLKIYKKVLAAKTKIGARTFFRKTFLISNRNLIHQIFDLLVRIAFRRELGNEDVADKDDDHGDEAMSREYRVDWKSLQPEPEDFRCRRR